MLACRNSALALGEGALAHCHVKLTIGHSS